MLSTAPPGVADRFQAQFTNREVLRSRFIGILRGNLIAVIALPVALGGFAYANERNSVGGKKSKVPKVRTTTATMPAGQGVGVVRNCSGGETYLSGGYDAAPADAPAQPLNVSTAGPNFSGKKNKPIGFNFVAENTGTVEAPLAVYAVCMLK